MARKSDSDQEREQIKETLLTAVIECIVNRGLIHTSIDVLCKKAGISKTFFYTFFSLKEELVLQALRYQQPGLLRYARQLMNDPALSWREDGIDPRLFGNLALVMMMVYKAIPDTMPFLFPEMAGEMVDFQIQALLDKMERIKEGGEHL